jgi:hypothetical protein
MVGRVTANGVAVRAAPDLDAPLVPAEIATGDGGQIADFRADAGQQVVVTLGPVYADGLSWYYVHPEGTGDVHFLGWIAGEYLARDGDYARPFGSVDGFGTGGTIEMDLLATAPVVVTLAANVVDGDDACHFVADLVRADGSVVRVYETPVTGPIFARVGASDLPGMVQTVDGTMTLRVQTDCSFAATMSVLG